MAKKQYDSTIGSKAEHVKDEMTHHTGKAIHKGADWVEQQGKKLEHMRDRK